MELIETPNPNAKKILTEVEVANTEKELNKIDGIKSVFLGPGFITITKEEHVEWESINQDIINIFDKL